MHDELIQKFYEAFQKRDYATMQSCYHEEAQFTDPVFQNLNSQEVKAMWQMLSTSAKDLEITFKMGASTANASNCHWEAWYTFSRTGRKVHNIIEAVFEFKDGKIYCHRDFFDFWRWSRQALGFSGVLLGWSPIIKKKVQTTARQALDKFMT